ncbi:hypothetical protein HYC85_026203 [Camellia sinensis]|uniref:Uncharacterized protein n=1 Tax=Camellia sinensis TaxID=4442 RepID=A0A7J7G6X6_CAMSI|nr:hypothetical protein HYC85_026203 [Camellia sinensis]
METLTKELHLWVLWLLFFSFSVTASYTDYANRDNPSITYTYTRFADIEKHCGFILPSASE